MQGRNKHGTRYHLPSYLHRLNPAPCCGLCGLMHLVFYVSAGVYAPRVPVGLRYSPSTQVDGHGTSDRPNDGRGAASHL